LEDTKIAAVRENMNHFKKSLENFAIPKLAQPLIPTGIHYQWLKEAVSTMAL
jgi:hypothetical protein